MLFQVTLGPGRPALPVCNSTEPDPESSIEVGEGEFHVHVWFPEGIPVYPKKKIYEVLLG